ncbi:PQ-loop repeat-containing protein [bacterium]|nr:PQ-loop repeat-containing protein [bacterium]
MMSLFAWVSQVLYTVCFLPQIVTNFRAKSGRGMSEYLLLGYLNLLAVTLFYVFLLELPLAYKIFVPLQLTAVLLLIAQRLWYDGPRLAKNLGIMYLVNIALLVGCIPYALENPSLVGNMGGWGNVLFGVLSQSPQAFKVWRERSVMGFDKRFVYMLLAGSLCEFTGAFLCNLPLQTKLTSLRGITFACVFLFQFKLYASARVTSKAHAPSY